MLGERTTQHAVGSCGHCGEMPLKIMLNVRDTQTHSSRRLVPLSTAKPIYCNTRERSIKPHIHMHCHKSSLLFARLAGNHGELEAPTPTPETLMQPTQVSRSAVGVKTQTVSIPRQTRCKTDIKECRKTRQKPRKTWLTPKSV